MRFCKQRDKYSCGAIALLNIDKFFGHRATYQDLPRYQELVKCGRPHGTLIRNMTRVLGRASRRSWRNAKRFLQKRNCILILSGWGNGGHYFLMVMDNRNYHLVNHESSAVIGISSQDASWILKHAKRTWYVSEGIL